MDKILVTGGSGCVGTYVLRALLQQSRAQVLAVVRNPARLSPALRNDPRLTVIEADLRETDRIAAQAKGVETAILIATAWGGDDTMDVTCTANRRLGQALAAAGCGHVLYFGTASVLDRTGALNEFARTHGTPYVQAKYALVEAMEALHSPTMRVTGLFPTLVLGGEPASDGAPISHLAALMPQIARHLWLIRLLDADAALHLVHPQDIATVVVRLIQHPPETDTPARLVLGNPATRIGDLVEAACIHFGMRRRAIITLRPSLAEFFVRLFRIQLSHWDRFCMENPDQSYDDPVNPACFDLPVFMPDLASGLTSIGLPGRR